MRGRIGGLIVVAVFLFVVLVFCSIAQAKKGGGGGRASFDSFPSRIAGDSGIVSGTWFIPYTDAANATDGDLSTYSFGSTVGDGSGENTEAYVTWDMGSIFDVSIVTIKWDISTPGGGLFMQVSQDNVGWINDGSSLSFSPTSPFIRKEQTFMASYRIRYIRFVGQTTSTTPIDFRIYEIKVR